MMYRNEGEISLLKQKQEPFIWMNNIFFAWKKERIAFKQIKSNGILFN